MMRILTFVLVVVTFAAPYAAADEWPTALGQEGECVVCARRGGAHGAEKYVAWREHDGAFYGFCSEPCAEAFDQMPTGYAPPVLPRPAPEFRWGTLDGATVERTGQRALLVDFWATWCAPCLEAIPEFESLATEFRDRGLKVVGVSIDEKRKTLDGYLKRKPIAYSIVHDGGDDPAWWQFRVPAIPAAFLLDGEGQVVAQWSGKVDVEQVHEAVEAVLAGE